MTKRSSARAANYIALALALKATAACAQREAPTVGINQRVSCTITRVSDGDSVVCDPYGRVRLLLIDAPEMSDRKLGGEARNALLSIMPIGTKIVVETDVRVKDQYGRLLAYLFLPGGRMINERMAETGYAMTLVYPPNVKYAERIRSAVARARAAKRGFWGTGGFDCSPRDYRGRRC